MAKKAVARKIGTYNSRDDLNVISDLASQISGEKPQYLAIELREGKYLVSSLTKDPFPAAFGGVRWRKITKASLEVILSVTADLIEQGIINRSFLRRENRDQKQFYAVYND